MKVAAIIILIGLSFFIVKDYWWSIIGAFLLAYIFYPVYKFINKYLRVRWLSAALVIILILVLILVPLIYMLNIVSGEAISTYNKLKAISPEGSMFSLHCDNLTEKNQFLCSITESEMFADQNVREVLRNSVATVVNQVLKSTSDFLLGLPNVILNLFLMFFLLFYLLTEKDRAVAGIKKYMPFSEDKKEEILKNMNSVTGAILMGQFMTALLQGGVALIGYVVFGTSAPLLWGLLTVFASLIPFLGSSLIWMPLAIFMIISGYTGNNNVLLFKGFGLFLYGMLIVSLIDNFVRPKLIGDRASIHPAIILVGLFGGIAALGVIGMILGPLILALTFTVMRIYNQEAKADEAKG